MLVLCVRIKGIPRATCGLLIYLISGETGIIRTRIQSSRLSPTHISLRLSLNWDDCFVGTLQWWGVLGRGRGRMVRPIPITCCAERATMLPKCVATWCGPCVEYDETLLPLCRWWASMRSSNSRDTYLYRWNWANTKFPWNFTASAQIRCVLNLHLSQPFTNGNRLRGILQRDTLQLNWPIPPIEELVAFTKGKRERLSCKRYSLIIIYYVSKIMWFRSFGLFLLQILLLIIIPT